MIKKYGVATNCATTVYAKEYPKGISSAQMSTAFISIAKTFIAILFLTKILLEYENSQQKKPVLKPVTGPVSCFNRPVLFPV
jgi:hypothetical protein